MREIMQWESQKQQENKRNSQLASIQKLITRKRKQNTYSSNGITWTLPDNSLTVSLSDLKEALNY